MFGLKVRKRLIQILSRDTSRYLIGLGERVDATGSFLYDSMECIELAKKYGQDNSKMVKVARWENKIIKLKFERKTLRSEITELGIRYYCCDVQNEDRKIVKELPDRVKQLETIARTTHIKIQREFIAAFPYDFLNLSDIREIENLGGGDHSLLNKRYLTSARGYDVYQ